MLRTHRFKDLGCVTVLSCILTPQYFRFEMHKFLKSKTVWQFRIWFFVILSPDYRINDNREKESVFSIKRGVLA